MGPVGGMYLPYDLTTYYTMDYPDKAAQKEVEKSMMKMMYGPMFKYETMYEFMSFMDINGWNVAAYNDVVAIKKVEPRGSKGWDTDMHELPFSKWSAGLEGPGLF
jgi:hypothetical protein